MPQSFHRIAFVVFPFTLFVPARADDRTPIPVQARSVDIHYVVNDDALPLDAVELWYTQDDGLTWQPYGIDEDRQSPITFRAPSEGSFGFFFVLRNATGASSAPPSAAISPQIKAFVDFTPPVVQLHPLRIAQSLGEPIVQIRWTAVDAHLEARPINVEYQERLDQVWKPAIPEAIANTGRLDWRPPDGLSGVRAVRVLVRDKGGHQVVSESQMIDMYVPVDSAAALIHDTHRQLPDFANSDDTTVTGSPRAQERVAELQLQARTFTDRGDIPAAIGRFREIVRLDPGRTDAFVQMAALLRQVGDLDRSLGAYDIALRQKPKSRDALLGSAVALSDKKQYDLAAERLRTILRNQPNDAEAWMHLGDVAIFRGDELLARECYTRATHIDPAAARVIVDARQRLALMINPSDGG